ncbi:hypothetical protein QJS10_CPB21g00196 [Acorus calamus]|uniref:DUF3741 domain-containing protein n=1 Tax=Acorus calamus TaxID=4465 RepID=A0AAV9C5S4_ACOCL|nr:hypothetical protein QJS10_CPB21g00196 [Acorus calamus]
MGRMINIFDLSVGMSGNRLITDRPHRDGSPVRRNYSDAPKEMLDPVGSHVEDKSTVKEPRRGSPNKKSSGTPMKMLIAQEMSKDTEPKRKPHNVVARLMGLDTLPAQQPSRNAQRSFPEVHPHDSYTQSRMMRHQSQENGLEDDIHSGSYTSLEQGDYRDVYEVQHQSSRINHFKDQSPRKGISNEIPNEKKMALVRQKFVEAKRLSTDEKLRQSKEFQDALEVLSSNRDLFLRFLQEPSSLLSKHLHELQSVAQPPQTKRITVLKPSKTVEMNGLAGLDFGNEKQTKTQYQAPEMNQWDSNEKNKPCWSQELSHQRTEVTLNIQE